jgi:hypothetical protein
VPILLQKSLPVSVRGDSVALMRFATEAGDDGVTQSRSKTAFLFIPSRGCGSRRSFGPSDCGGSRPVVGACRACTVLSKAWLGVKAQLCAYYGAMIFPCYDNRTASVDAVRVQTVPPVDEAGVRSRKNPVGGSVCRILIPASRNILFAACGNAVSPGAFSFEVQ